MTTSNIKEKIAKLLRMQESSNSNEAANAAAFVERLCREHGLTPADCEQHNPDEDLAVAFTYGKTSGRLDRATSYLLQAVANYFNGYMVQCGAPGGRVRKVYAVKANQIQIELYTDYLIDVMNKLAKEHFIVAGSPRNNFKKGFAVEIARRLQAMALERQKDGIAETGMPGLVVTKRDKKQNRLALAARDNDCPNLRTSYAKSLGYGAEAGAEAAKSVGLNKQVRTTGQRMLTGV